MNPIYHNLTQPEARHWLTLPVGGTMVIVKPTRRQPDCVSPEYQGITSSMGKEFAYWKGDGRGDAVEIKFTLNSTVLLRECWRYSTFTDDGDAILEYKADGETITLIDRSYEDEWCEWTDLCVENKIPFLDEYGVEVHDDSGRFRFSEEHPNPAIWRSSQCMPHEAIIKSGIVVGNECKQENGKWCEVVEMEKEK
jgi:hypothetical protein